MRWDANHHSPATISNLGFVRRGLAAREVWSEFLRMHLVDLQELYGIESIRDFQVDASSDEDGLATVVRGVRRRSDLPVDGQMFEARISGPRSPLGPGILTRLDLSWSRDLGRLPESFPRWIDQTTALARASARLHVDNQRVTNAALRLSCADRCTGYWSLGWSDGQGASVSADTQEIVTFNNTTHIGPARIMGRPPGATSEVPIRLRGTSIVDTNGVEVDGTHWSSGEHSQSTSNTRRVGFVGITNATHGTTVGRIVRVPAPGESSPFPVEAWQNWTPSATPSPTFNWSANSTFYRPYSHAMMLTWGWVGYYQTFFRDTLGVEVADSLELHTFPRSWIGDAALGFNGQQNSTNGAPPYATSSWISVAVGTNDDVNANENVEGEAALTVAHEYAHMINACLFYVGVGCENGNPAAFQPNHMQRQNHSAWRFSVHGSAVENGANYMSNALTRYRYNSNLDGTGYSPDWVYENYQSVGDDFGSETQGIALDAWQEFPQCGLWGGCGTNDTCVVTDAHPKVNPSGLCRPTQYSCTPTTCPRGLECGQPLTTHPPNSVACWYNAYQNQFWNTVGARLTIATNWQDALLRMMNGFIGQASNALRDLVDGGDNYYDRLAQAPETRFEVSRAVRSIYVGQNFFARDDFTNYISRGIPVVSNQLSPTRVWWGNGLAQYPRFEDFFDGESIVFRMEAGQSTTVIASRVFASGYPYIDLYRLGASVTWIDSSSTGVLVTPVSPNSDWYSAYIWGASPSEWQASISLTTGSDDVSQNLNEAYPLVDDVPFFAHATANDIDAFEIYVPTGIPSVEIHHAGAVGATVFVFDPSSNYVAMAALAPGNSMTFSTSSITGMWKWLVVPSAVGTYSTHAKLTPPAGCPDAGFAGGCNALPPVRSVRYGWGDRFAASFSLQSAGNAHLYDVDMAEGQRVVIGTTDMAADCQLSVAVIPPPALRFYNGQAAVRWTDGGATGDVGNNGQSAGGSFEAMEAGIYQIEVRRTPMTTCQQYRLYVGRTGESGPVWPTW